MIIPATCNGISYFVLLYSKHKATLSKLLSLAWRLETEGNKPVNKIPFPLAVGNTIGSYLCLIPSNKKQLMHFEKYIIYVVKYTINRLLLNIF